MTTDKLSFADSSVIAFSLVFQEMQFWIVWGVVVNVNNPSSDRRGIY